MENHLCWKHLDVFEIYNVAIKNLSNWPSLTITILINIIQFIMEHFALLTNDLIVTQPKDNIIDTLRSAATIQHSIYWNELWDIVIYSRYVSRLHCQTEFSLSFSTFDYERELLEEFLYHSERVNLLIGLMNVLRPIWRSLLTIIMTYWLSNIMTALFDLDMCQIPAKYV